MNIDEMLKDNVANGRRFCFLSEVTGTDGNDLLFNGFVHGKVKVNDAIYIMKQDEPIMVATIGDLKVDDKSLEEVCDKRCEIRIKDIKDKVKTDGFIVITSIRPQREVKLDVTVENPFLLGLSYGFQRFGNDMNYLVALIKELTKANYLVPVILASVPEGIKDGKIPEGTVFSVPSFLNPSDKSKSLLPVFTDFEEVRSWKNDVWQKQKTTIVTNFKDTADLSKKNDNGMVINPFGENPIILTTEMIDGILNNGKKD